MKRTVDNGIGTTPKKGNAAVYELVTERFVKALEAGTAPWQMPWLMRAHKNGMSGYTYKGINRLLTALSAHEAESRGETFTHLWLTLKQANKLGGRVRKGERSTIVILWKPVERDTGEVDEDGEKVTERIWLLRYYRVFNYAQTEGVTLPKKVAAELDGNDHGEPDEKERRAEAVWAEWADKPVEQESTTAWYRPQTDTIGLPPRALFHSPAAFWATRFHEGIHATGHESRLDRDGVTGTDGFAGEKYSREELVAEMGSAFLLAEVGLLNDKVFDNSAAYLAGWLKALKEDGRLVVSAATKAERAARYIAPADESTSEVSDTEAA